jgi:4,5-dihydroxyphthalate decarboxylase
VTAKNLNLTLACGWYDRTAALFDGSISPEGIDLSCIAMNPGELFRRMAADREFSLAEMSFSTYLNLRARGDVGLVGIPVFPSRAFRHSYVFINRNAGIETPADLRGKRVGTMQYQLTSNLWMRGILEDDYGVPPTAFTWCFGGQDEPGGGERAAVSIPEDIDREMIGDDETLSDLLVAGRIDALLAPHIPTCFRDRHPNVGRLFPDFKTVEAAYYRRTGFFPIMHLVVIRADVYRRHPWIAVSLFNAFTAAKKSALERLQFTGTLAAMVPWVFADLEEAEELFGSRYWPYGVEPNRGELETMIVWARRHGIAIADLAVTDLFAAETISLQ